MSVVRETITNLGGPAPPRVVYGGGNPVQYQANTGRSIHETVVSRPITETVTYPAVYQSGPISPPFYHGGAPQYPDRYVPTVQPAAPPVESVVRPRLVQSPDPTFIMESTVVQPLNRSPPQIPVHGMPSHYSQPVRVQPVRPEWLRPLDRIHEDGHPDVARFTTEELKVFHEYLTKSSESGRSTKPTADGEGDKKIQTNDAVEKIIKHMKDALQEGKECTDQETLEGLLMLCEISHGRSKKYAGQVVSAGFVDVICRFFSKFTEMNINDQIKYPVEYVAFNLLLDAVQRFTEVSPDLCREMVAEGVSLLLEIVENIFFSVDALNRDDEELKWMSRREVLKKLFTILYNCIRNCPDSRCRDLFRARGTSDILKPFLDCRFFILRAKALFILAYIVTEEENAELNTTSLNIEFIVKILRRALEGPDHYSAHYNFFAAEVAEAVQYVAANDDNKNKFVDAGVLPYLVAMMGTENPMPERISALKASWILSFSVTNKDKIKEEKGLIEAVKNCAECPEMARSCESILWNVGLLSREELPRQKKDESKADDGTSTEDGTALQKPEGAVQIKDTKEPETKLPHIMLSYQWDVQKEILKVKDILKAHGFNVWMDVEQMGGSTLEAMASAVEDSAVVIVCFSEKYKDSPACRTEAEYTYKLRKAIVPLKMQRGFDPNGWLGAMLGTKLYIEMFTERLVEENMRLLIRELANRGRLTPQSGDVDPGAMIPFDPPRTRPSSPALTNPMSAPAAGAQIRRVSATGSIVLDYPRNVTPPPPGHAGRIVETVERVVYVDKPVVQVVEVPVAVPSFAPAPRKDAIWSNIVQQFDEEGVKNFLRSHNFTHVHNFFFGFRGEDLIGLKKIAGEAPEFFFRKLEVEFGITTTLEMIRFKRMLDNII